MDAIMDAIIDTIMNATIDAIMDAIVDASMDAIMLAPDALSVGPSVKLLCLYGRS